MIFSEEAKNREITGFHHELCESRILFTPSTISLSVMGRVCKKPFQFIAILSKQNNCFLSLKSFLQAIFSPFFACKRRQIEYSKMQRVFVNFHYYLKAFENLLLGEVIRYVKNRRRRTNKHETWGVHCFRRFLKNVFLLNSGKIANIEEKLLSLLKWLEYVEGLQSGN